MTKAKALGIRTVRYSLDAASATLRAGFATFRASGFRLVTTANHQQGAPDAGGHRPVAQLDAAVGVAHARHVKITNGGLTSDPVALLTWQDLERRGLDARADRFAARVFSTPGRAWTLRDLRADPFKASAGRSCKPRGPAPSS